MSEARSAWNSHRVPGAPCVNHKPKGGIDTSRGSTGGIEHPTAAESNRPTGTSIIMAILETDSAVPGCIGRKAHGVGGHVITAQPTRAEVESLADAACQELLVKMSHVMAAEGEMKLWTERGRNGFGRFILNTSSSSASSQRRISEADVRRLAADVRAAILRRATVIDAAAIKVLVAIRPSGTGFSIRVSVDY